MKLSEQVARLESAVIDLDNLLGEVLATVLLNIDNVVAIKHVSECRRVTQMDTVRSLRNDART